MANATTDNSTILIKTDRYDRHSLESRRKRRIQNVKTGGDLMMYVGSAGLMIPMIQKARERENGVMGLCAAGAGAVLAIGLGNLASNIFNKTVDKVVGFWDDVKPSAPVIKKTEQKDISEDESQEEKSDG